MQQSSQYATDVLFHMKRQGSIYMNNIAHEIGGTEDGMKPRPYKMNLSSVFTIFSSPSLSPPQGSLKFFEHRHILSPNKTRTIIRLWYQESTLQIQCTRKNLTTGWLFARHGSFLGLWPVYRLAVSSAWHLFREKGIHCQCYISMRSMRSMRKSVEILHIALDINHQFLVPWISITNF